jgi:RNA-binding protein
MITSKQRAYLRGMANKLESIIQIGKGGASPDLVSAVREALDARELIKMNVLENCDEDVKELAQLISERTRSDVVQVIGRKIVLFKQSNEKPVIELPKK